jgi:hypothetical protein
MEDKPQNVICQNCKGDFTIEPDDFSFYEKIKVPAPTFCPECRAQRRMSFLNERIFYRRKCDMTGETVVSLFREDAEVPVYSPKAWWSDNWDATDYGQEYDFTKPFFEQFGKLLRRVPQFALQNQYTTLINTEYVNMGTYLKNCYMVTNTAYSENASHTSFFLRGKDCIDVYNGEQCELCYEGVNLRKCFRTLYSEDCQDCIDVLFSKNLRGCTNCIGCFNLRNKSNYIFNQPFSKEAYSAELEKCKLDTNEGVLKMRELSDKNMLKYPRKYMEGSHNTNVSGDYIFNSKNTFKSFKLDGVEDSKYCQFVFYKPARDCYDMTLWGQNATNIYECMGAGDSQNMIKFSFDCWAPAVNIEYSYHVTTQNNNLFGCVGLKNKNYCILNKQYGEKEFFEMVEKIKKHMMEMPYVDKKGRVYKYGEFFPTEISLFPYNETLAQSYFPLTKEEMNEKGFSWREREFYQYPITIKAKDLSENIKDVKDSILDEVIECLVSKRAFKITVDELNFYRRMNIPLPRLHPDERHKNRLARQNPMKLWYRKCMKEGCSNEFETSYAPERPEIIYCERCYQAEVY